MESNKAQRSVSLDPLAKAFVPPENVVLAVPDPASVFRPRQGFAERTYGRPFGPEAPYQEVQTANGRQMGHILNSQTQSGNNQNDMVGIMQKQNKSLHCWFSKIYPLFFLQEICTFLMEIRFNIKPSLEPLKMWWRRKRIIPATVCSSLNSILGGSQRILCIVVNIYLQIKALKEPRVFLLSILEINIKLHLLTWKKYLTGHPLKVKM